MTVPRLVRQLRYWGAWLGGGFALGLTLAVIWVWLLEPAVNPPQATDLVIPKGTAAAVAAGEPAPFIPTTLSLSSIRELRVQNNDVVTHKVAGFDVPPGGSATIKPDAKAKALVCTVHPSGYLGLTIEERPGIAWILLLAFLSGVPFGALSGAIVFITRRLDDGGSGPSAVPA